MKKLNNLMNLFFFWQFQTPLQINTLFTLKRQLFMLFLVCVTCTLYTRIHSIFLASRHVQQVRCRCIRVRFIHVMKCQETPKKRIISLDHIYFGIFPIIIHFKIFHSFLSVKALNLSQMNMKSAYHFHLFKLEKNTYLYITFVYSSLR